MVDFSHQIPILTQLDCLKRQCFSFATMFFVWFLKYLSISVFQLDNDQSVEREKKMRHALFIEERENFSLKKHKNGPLMNDHRSLTF